MMTPTDPPFGVEVMSSSQALGLSRSDSATVANPNDEQIPRLIAKLDDPRDSFSTVSN
jgi:hypothetical protein